MSKLTTEQVVVLAFFEAHDAGAMRCMGRWVWPDDLAVRFIQHRAEEYRDSEMLRAWLAPIGKAVRQ